MKKLTYQVPMLRAHGTVEAVTNANTGGSRLDGSFDAGTPLSDLTTS